MQEPSAQKHSGAIRQLFSGRAGFLRLASIVLIVGLTVVAFLIRDHLPSVEKVGYPAVFLISFISSASVLIPFPGVAAVCVAATVLSPIMVSIVASVGMTLGELTAYFAGAQNRDLAMRMGKNYDRIRRLMENRGTLILFVLAAVPNLVFDVAGFVAGALRYPVSRFLGIVFVGKLIKSTVFAYACMAGIHWAQRFFS